MTSAVKKPAARATARKGVARKPRARKAAAAQNTVRRIHRSLKDKLSLDKVTESAKDVAYAQLGLYGKVYDELNERLSKARVEAPRQWNDLVKRGEQVRRDLEKAQKDLRKDIKARVESFDVKGDINQRIDQVRSAVAKIRERVQIAA